MTRATKITATQRNRNAMRALRKEVNGGSLNPPADPPHVNLQPFYPLTVVPPINNGLPVSVNDVLTAVSTQLTDSTAIAEGIDILIHSVKAWGDDESAFVQLEAFDFTDSVPAVDIRRETFYYRIDYAGKNRRAKLGFMWPSRSQNNVQTFKDESVDTRPVFIATAPPMGGVTVYIHVSWRPRSVLPSFTISRSIPSPRPHTDVGMVDEQD